MTTTSKPMRIAGWALTGLFTAFMILDAGMKLARAPIVEQTSAQMHIPAGAGFGIGVMEAAILILYLIPRTAVLGAILLTGYLGGAVATHLRVADTARAAIPLVVGILAWAGLYLRDSRIRQLVPFRRRERD